MAQTSFGSMLPGSTCASRLKLLQELSRLFIRAVSLKTWTNEKPTICVSVVDDGVLRLRNLFSMDVIRPLQKVVMPCLQPKIYWHELEMKMTSKCRTGRL